MSGKVTRFTDLDVWRKAHRLFVDLCSAAAGLRGNRVAEMTTEQLIRAVGSIGANIAEGFNRSQKRFVNALDIALGEANEAENWLYKVRDTGFMTGEACTHHIRAIIEIQRMLSGLKREIANNENALREGAASYDTGLTEWFATPEAGP